MKIKNKYKKIFLLLVIILISGLLLNSTYAAITVDGGKVGTNEGFWPNLMGIAAETFYAILEAPLSGLLAPISWTITLLAIILFAVLGVVFAVGTGDVTHLPLPDTIVFNRFAFFDANFINPANNSLLSKMSGVLADLFASFQTVAIALFVVAAMVAGIKMALSTIASKKAQYKEAAMKWLTGFIILLCLKYLIAGIFYLNEYLVATLSGITESVKIPIHILNMVPGSGGTWSNAAIGIMQNVFGLENHQGVTAQGYLGIVLANIFKAIGGDIIASVVAFIIMGQAITIVGSYIKRLFMSVLLGMIAPMIVAADTIVSAQGKQSNIFKNWLKNFTLTVFMQSVHALYMVVTIQILSVLYGTNEGDSIINDMLSGGTATAINFFQLGIVTIVLTTGLIKLEKMFKTLFGIGDSFAGDLRDGAKGMLQAMGAVRGLGAGISAVADNKKKVSDASKKKKAYVAELAELKASLNTKGGNSGEGDTSGGNGGTGKGKSDGGNVKETGNYKEDVVKKQMSKLTTEQRIQELEAGIAEETANAKAGKLASVMGVANLVGGLGIGLGMGDDIGESLFKGGYITKGLDYATERIGYGMADKDRRTFRDYEASEGEKYGYTPSEKIIREKTTVEKYVNPKLLINEWDKQIKQIGEVFGDTMKKELRKIDREVDNQ